MALWAGAVPALFAAYLRRAVPESPRYLEKSGKPDKADQLVRIMEKEAGFDEYPHENHLDAQTKEIKVRMSLIELWSAKYIRSTAVLWTIWFGINFGYYGFVLWTSLLVAQDLIWSRALSLL